MAGTAESIGDLSINLICNRSSLIIVNFSRSHSIKGATGAKIMVVDTDQNSARAMRNILSKNRHPARCFYDPERALAEFTKHPDRYRSIVVTLRMSGMSGFDFIRKIKKIAIGAKVILVTDFRMTGFEFSKVFPSCQVDGIVVKPAQGPELLGAVDSRKATQVVDSFRAA